MMRLALLSLLITLTYGLDPSIPVSELDNCFSCASKSGSNRICHKVEPAKLLEDEGQTKAQQAVCCNDANDDKDYCVAKKDVNDCSDSYESAPYKWHAHCPGIAPKYCGGHIYLIPIAEKQKWGYQGMRYYEGGAPSQWKKPKDPRYDACYWKIHVPEYRWKSANINVQFSDKQDGINVHLFGDDGVGDGVYQLTQQIVPGNEQPKIGEIYTTTQDFNMTIIAYPDKDSTNTNFEFEFWLEGEEYPVLEQYYNEYIGNTENEFLYATLFFCGLAAIFLLMICGIFLLICKCCCRNRDGSENQVGITELTDGQQQQQYGKTANVSQTRDDLYIESLGNENQDGMEVHNPIGTHDSNANQEHFKGNSYLWDKN